MKPSIGRIVHTSDESGNLRAGIITAVWNESCINLTRFEVDGTIVSATSCVLTDGIPKTSIEWNWPEKV